LPSLLNWVARVDSEGASKSELVGYPIFDWLRLVLASIVALGHAGLVAHSEILGNLAVQVFFSLSGWLIGGILLRSRLDQVPRFFFNRATRIWLPYFFAVAALYSLSAMREPINIRWLEFLYYDVTFTHNWFSLRPSPIVALPEMPLKGTGHGFWSISVEEQFYLVAPLIIVAVKFGRSSMLWVLITTILWCFQLTDFASISLGVLAASLHSSYKNAHLRGWFVVTLVFVLLLSALVLSRVSYAMGAPFFATSTVLLCARPGHRSPIGIFAGAISYPMYLNHWMGAFLINGIAKRFDWLTQPLTGILSYALSLAVGAAAYLIIDRTVMAYRDLFYSATTGKVLAAVAYGLVLLGLIGGFSFAR
jgi:peptidoglycan/LPS O-acetylase OafA/YrhL